MAKKNTENTESRPTSRVFISRSNVHGLRQTYPERKPSGFDEYLPSHEASQIRNNADVVCVYSDGSKGKGYGGELKDGTRFELSVDDWDVHIGQDEYEERFAKETEKKLGRKGLILIRY